MPLYEYKCDACGREFEDLCTAEKKDEKRPCPSCSNSDKVIRKISSFGIKTTLTPGKDTIYSPKEIDKVVGNSSDKGWEAYHDRANKVHKERQEKRRAGKDVKEVVIGKGADGTVRPFEHLGDSKERTFRKEYSKEYKTQLEEKGKNTNKVPVRMKVDL